jgi:hypothetical protein
MNSEELTKKGNLTQITGSIKNTLEVVSLYSLVKIRREYKDLPVLEVAAFEL